MKTRAVIAITLTRLLLLHAPPAGAAERPDPALRYVFYLHGRIVELKGPDAVSDEYGAYDYDGNVKALSDRGFVVRSELRPASTTLAYADKVAAEVRALLAAGVPPSHITVAGHSKGGHLALAAAAALANSDLKFVIMAGCFEGNADLQDRASKIKGHVLSIVDESDSMARSCKPLLEEKEGVDLKEIVTKTGLGHGLFFRPRREWLDPLADFAKGDATPKR